MDKTYEIINSLRCLVSKLFLGIEDATKQKVKQDKLSQSQPLSFLDNLTDQLGSIETKYQPTPVRLDLINPHLKRVVSNRGRKQTLKKEEDQFRKVLSHPAFMNNPLGTIGTHLNNTMKQINNLPTKKE